LELILTQWRAKLFFFFPALFCIWEICAKKNQKKVLPSNFFLDPKN
jgi:hypothetical protein